MGSSGRGAKEVSEKFDPIIDPPPHERGVVVNDWGLALDVQAARIRSRFKPLLGESLESIQKSNSVTATTSANSPRRDSLSICVP